MDRRELLKAAAGLACVGPVAVPAETAVQYMLYYPPGLSDVEGVEVSNRDIARDLLEAITQGGSLAIPQRQGWELYKNVNGEFVPVRTSTQEEVRLSPCSTTAPPSSQPSN